MKERATFVSDIWQTSHFFFSAPSEYDEKTLRKKWKENTPNILTSVVELFASITDFNAENIESAFKAHLEKNEWGLGMVYLLSFVSNWYGYGTFYVCHF